MPKLDLEELTREGCKYRVVSTRRLTDLQSEIECRIENHQFDREIQETHLTHFTFSPPQTLENAKSIIIVAMPRPPTRATFNWNGKKQTFILPPTYTAYDQKRIHVEEVVADAVGKLGYRSAPANLPLKLLAVRSGLATYGKNNIAYVEGMGSFMRLVAVYTDMPTESHSWHEPKTMHRCTNCEICQYSCPTGAISRDRFMLHAEKCLTYHNEKPGSVPFPSWIKPEWHNSIVGCIRCQQVCPENRQYQNIYGETTEFNQQETEWMLSGTSLDQMPQETVEKMLLLSLTDYYNELPRNLSVLLKKHLEATC